MNYKTDVLKIEDRNAKLACRHIMSTNISNTVLLGISQGIGNVILTTPLINALVSMNLKVDIITDGIIRNAEQCIEGMKGVTLLTEQEVKDSGKTYLLGLQTFWPYEGLQKYVAQVRYVGNMHEIWKDNIPAHEVEINMSLAYSLKYDKPIPGLYCNYNEWNFKKSDFAIMVDRKVVGIHLCRTYNCQFFANRQLRNPIAIAEALVVAGFTPVILGKEGSRYEGDIYPKETIDMTGKDLKDTAGIIRELDCMINEDSGIMHMTAAMSTPQVSVFGPTAYVKNRAWSEKCVMVRRGLDCSPCQYTKLQNECFKNNCMDIDPYYVVQQVKELIG